MRKSACFFRRKELGGKGSHNEYVEVKHSLKYCSFMDVPESKAQRK